VRIVGRGRVGGPAPLRTVQNPRGERGRLSDRSTRPGRRAAGRRLCEQRMRCGNGSSGSLAGIHGHTTPTQVSTSQSEPVNCRVNRTTSAMTATRPKMKVTRTLERPARHYEDSLASMRRILVRGRHALAQDLSTMRPRARCGRERVQELSDQGSAPAVVLGATRLAGRPAWASRSRSEPSHAGPAAPAGSQRLFAGGRGHPLRRPLTRLALSRRASRERRHTRLASAGAPVPTREALGDGKDGKDGSGMRERPGLPARVGRVAGQTRGAGWASRGDS
jgi:hypothetical protein